KEAREPLAQVISSPKEPMRVRELAVEALGDLAVKREDASAGDVLAKALREDAQGTYGTLSPAAGEGAGKVGMGFPVRKAAAEGIGKLEKAGVALPSYVTQAAKEVKWEVTVPEGGGK